MLSECNFCSYWPSVTSTVYEAQIGHFIFSKITSYRILCNTNYRSCQGLQYYSECLVFNKIEEKCVLSVCGVTFVVWLALKQQIYVYALQKNV